MRSSSALMGGLAPRMALVSAMVTFSAAPALAADIGVETPTYRIVDVGVRPVVSFPDALGISMEAHPLGGGLAVEVGAGAEPIEAMGLSAALKYRFDIRRSATFQGAIGPGVGSLWLFDGLHGPLTGQLVSGFVASEAVWWHDSLGFRLGLDLGVATAVVDKPDYGKLGTYPVFNGTIGIAFRAKRRS